MAPPKNPKHVQGQSSLSSFFPGATRMSLEPKPKKEKKEKEESSSSTPTASTSAERSSSPSKSGSKKKSPSTGIEKPKVSVDQSSFTISGRISASPTKRSTTPAKQKEETPSSSVEIVGDTKMSSSKPTSKNSVGASSSSGGKGGPMSGDKAASAILIDDSDDDIPVSSTKKKVATGSKRKVETDDESEEEFPAVKSKSAAKKSKVSPARGKGKGKKKDDSDSDDDIFEEDEKPKVKAKKAPAKKAAPKKEKGKAKNDDEMDVDNKEDEPKYNFAAALARKAAGPAAPGSKEIPVGQVNCLAGLTLVFTGELESLGREEATNLAKRYGAKVTQAVSSKTSYVVLGGEPGPSKMKLIEKNRIATLDEDRFLALIAKRGAGEIDEKTMKKMEDEKKKVIETAKEFDQPVASGSGQPDLVGAKALAAASDPGALWTVKYAPRQLKDLVGNRGNVEKLREWLKAWPASLECNFKKPGKAGTNSYRAMMISGPPGTGKTTTAHLIARLEGYSPIELNASDARSKKLIEASMKSTINNTSLDGWYNGGTINRTMTSSGITIGDRSVIIMDEVDGMSGGDRGGVGAINALIKKTRVPIICICNDRKLPKMKPFENTTFNLGWRKPETPAIKSRLLSIAHKEGLKISGEVMESLITSAQSDMRSVINMLSTWALSQKSMDFDESKKLGAANEKPGMNTPFALFNEMTAAGMWAPTCKKNLNDKMDYYFQDFGIMPLMVQENYAKLKPRQAEVGVGSQKEREFKAMQLISKAALSISDGDVIDGAIHGTQQNWSLMPHHAIASVVRPLSCAYGMNSSGFPNFPSWLGKNSSQNRITRSAVELQTRMRLVTSGSRFAIRETYVPYLLKRLTDPLIKKGGDGIADVINIMDDYYLGTEDRDVILELGVLPKGDEILKKIPTATKTSFTKKYNTTSHPIAFWKPVEGTLKGIALKGAEAAPDLEEAYEQEPEGPEDEEAVVEEGDDMTKDKLIKAKKQKGKAAAKPKAKK